jgi:hypothetical protein
MAARSSQFRDRSRREPAGSHSSAMSDHPPLKCTLPLMIQSGHHPLGVIFTGPRIPDLWNGARSSGATGPSTRPTSVKVQLLLDPHRSISDGVSNRRVGVNLDNTGLVGRDGRSDGGGRSEARHGPDFKRSPAEDDVPTAGDLATSKGGRTPGGVSYHGSAGRRKSYRCLQWRDRRVELGRRRVPGRWKAMVAKTICEGHHFIVRHTRRRGPRARRGPNWRHFVFVTYLGGTEVENDGPTAQAACHRSSQSVPPRSGTIARGLGQCSASNR